MKKYLILFLVLIVFSSCQDSNINPVDFEIQIQETVEANLDMDFITKSYGELSYSELIRESSKGNGSEIVTIPFELSKDSKAVLVLPFEDRNLKFDQVFVAQLLNESDDFDFRIDQEFNKAYKIELSTTSLKSRIRTVHRVFENNPNKSEVNATNDLCEAVRTTGYEGFDYCSADNVGNCVGYHFCKQGRVSAIGCFIGFTACIGFITGDCIDDLCIDDAADKYRY